MPRTRIRVNRGLGALGCVSQSQIVAAGEELYVPARIDAHTRGRGFLVVSEPEAMGDGGTDAVLDDGGRNGLNPDQHIPAGVGG